MRSYFLPLLFVLAIAMACSSKDKRYPYQLTEHKVHVLRVPKTILSIDQNYGARIISLKYYGKELLSPYTINAENFGSTLWTSPQSDWGWPPIATFDVMPYDLNINGSELQFYSAPDKKSGFQIRKHLKLGARDSAFIITYSIKNVSDEEKSVAPWEVTRRRAGGISFFPGDPDSAILSKSNLPGVTYQDGIVWFEYDPKKIIADTKLYANASEGWLANVQDSILFLKSFSDIPTSQLPPDQGEVEIFADGTRSYIELENHGEYMPLFPGDSVVYKMKWLVKTIPAHIDKSVGSKDLVNWVRKVVFKNKFRIRDHLIIDED